jgi:flagellar hook-associated protein 2
MAQITSSIGLISGLNTSQIISELVSIDAQPVTLLQQQIDTVSEQTAAFNDLATSLQTIQSAGTTLASPLTFQNATTTSSDPSALTATASPGASIGSYQFSVARLVTTQQLVSQGVADPTTSSLGTGNITIDLGGGQLSTENDLNTLNGGSGVSLGEFKITDRSGATATIDTSNAVSLQDVVTDINTATGINVKASLDGNHIVLTDETSQTASNLIVQDVDDDGAASSLGIAGNSTTGTLTGTSINYLASTTATSSLNDGNGVQLGTGGADLSIDPGDGGSAVQVSLAGDTTVGAIVNSINTAAGSRLTAAASGEGITLTSASGGTIAVSDLNGSKAAEGLGLTTGTQSGSTLTGAPVLADLGTTLVSQLNGGSGLSLGTITVQSSANSGPTSINLSGATTVQQILDDVNNAGAGVTASLNNAGDGIAITDTGNGSGSLVIGGTTATELGLAGTFAAGSTATGTNLHHQYISAATTLANYNGGKGVAAGSFSITNSKGASSTIDTTNDTTIGDVINQINTANIGVTAGINQNGNGLVLTDTAGGTGELTVANTQGSTTATDLNIATIATGTGAANTIDGALEKTIAVTSTDTLTTLQQKINSLDFGVTAQIVNDGSASNGYRLSLSAVNSGTAGQVTVDDGTTNLNTTTLIRAQNAAVFFGDAGSGSKPILITSSTNTLNNVVNGVSISLNGVSQSPVTLNVTNDPSNVASTINNLVSNFNQTIEGISTLTSFNTTTDQPGLLLGDATVQTIQNQLYAAVNTVVKGAGNYTTLADIGLTLDEQGELSFDEDTFEAAYSDDPSDVTKLFTDATAGFGTVLNTDVTSLIDPISGTITQETNTLATRNQNYQDRLVELNQMVDDTRSRLQLQFANLETVLAGLQSQQSALGTISSVSAPTTSSSSSSSSSS